MVQLLLMFVACGLAQVPAPTPALKEISSVKIEEKSETVEVIFHPGKGSPAKAAAYALGFSALRGKEDPTKDPKKFRYWERGPTHPEVKSGKDKDSFLVVIDSIEGTTAFAGIFIKKIGPLTYDNDDLLMPIELITPVPNDASFDASAVSAQLWYGSAVTHFEEEWIAFHKERPLESPFKKGRTPVDKKSFSQRTFRIPRNLTVPYDLPQKIPESVTKK